jgi:transketolase C-terminal domain/subunit
MDIQVQEAFSKSHRLEQKNISTHQITVSTLDTQNKEKIFRASREVDRVTYKEPNRITGFLSRNSKT